ncbi:MAG: hypothetical protein ABWX84_02990 [Nocardioides sp.]
MNATTLRQAAYPTTRAITWAPLVAVGGLLLALGTVLRLLDGPPGPVLVLGAAAMAAALVFSLRDPAAPLLAAVPTPLIVRRVLRLALVGAVALPLWGLVATMLPGDGLALAPGLALTATGVAVATWLPIDRDVSVAAAVPLFWASATELLGGVGGVAGDALARWATDPWWVVAVAGLLVALGRHR